MQTKFVAEILAHEAERVCRLFFAAPEVLPHLKSDSNAFKFMLDLTKPQRARTCGKKHITEASATTLVNSLLCYKTSLILCVDQFVQGDSLPHFSQKRSHRASSSAINRNGHSSPANLNQSHAGGHRMDWPTWVVSVETAFIVRPRVLRSAPSFVRPRVWCPGI